ncbi:MAG: cytochrome c, partial [Bacteroidota bacterium]
MKKHYSIILLLLLPLFGFGQVTFSEHIAPIIYKNCTGCHRPGEVAPIPFTNYEEVKNWANMIQYVTEIRYMPPWPPNREYSKFLGERYLTDEELQLIADWVTAGTPQGDPSLEPPLPTFSTGSQIGQPDLVLEMSESYEISGNNQDDYRVFVLPTNFTEDKEVAAIEFRPGNNRAVHHVLFAYDLTGQARQRDAQSPNTYGYASFGDFGIPGARYLSWGYVPGALPLVFPEGLG